MAKVLDITLHRLMSAALCAALIFALGAVGLMSAPRAYADEPLVVELVEEYAAIQVSAEGDAALLEGSAWGLSGFSRSQAGSNRAVEGIYHGYNYYEGEAAGSLAVVSTGDYAVVYVPVDEAARFGIDVGTPADQELLRACLTALDAANAKGSSRLENVEKWHFTSTPVYEVGLARFEFDCELMPGRFYTCVIGVDGADVTAQSHAGYITLEHAGFARLALADKVVIAQAATGFAWLAEFLGAMDYRPLFVTLKTTGTAIVFIFALGLAAAYFTMRISARAQDIFDSVFTIPMVLPPTVCGFLLLLAFGRNTALGSWFYDIGFPLFFSWPATVIAAVVVAFPLMYRSARGAFEGLDANMLDAARTLGWSETKIFFRLMLPLSWSSIAAGTVLAFARALGEFGATLFLAGNYAGVTTTIPIAIYFEWMNGNTDVAIFWTLVIMAFSFLVILFINLWGRRTRTWRHIWCSKSSSRRSRPLRQAFTPTAFAPSERGGGKGDWGESEGESESESESESGSGSERICIYEP